MKKLIALVLLCVIALAGLMVCGSNEAVAAEKGKPVIAFVARVVGQPWWDYVRDNGVKKWAEENGIDVIYKGPANVEVEAQVQIMTDIIAQGVDILCFSPNDSASLENLCKEARDKGIIVIATEGSAMKNIDFDIEAFDEAGYGGFMMDQLAAQMGYEGEYITMVGDMTGDAQNKWADAAVARQEKEYPKMTLVADKRVTSEHDSEIAYQKTKELLKKYPNLKGIQGTSSFDAPGAARAIKELGLAGKVFVICSSVPSEISDYLHEGVMKAGALWDPSVTAKAMLNLGMMLYNGETVKTGADLGVPGYENVTVEGTLVTGKGMIAITVDNVDSFGF
jgi:simple sugar transport system substrate-binding protein